MSPLDGSFRCLQTSSRVAKFDAQGRKGAEVPRGISDLVVPPEYDQDGNRERNLRQ